MRSITGCTISSDNSEDSRKRAAYSLYQFDSQIENMLSGEDEETTSSSTTSTLTSGNDNREKIYNYLIENRLTKYVKSRYLQIETL